MSGAVQGLTPPLGYYGSKVRVAQRIIDLLPQHRGYVEPFAGSLSVLLAKPPVAFEVLNDLDEHLMTFWRVLRERPDDLARVCALTPHSRAEYAASWPIPPEVTDDLERARRVWVRLSQGRSGGLRTTGWRYHENPRGRSSSMPTTLRSYVARLAPAAERLAKVSLECRPALDIIHRYGRDPASLLYVDPPYLKATRNGTSYRREMPTPAEHRELAEALHACTAAVVISGYAHPLYDNDLYPRWHRTAIPTGTGQGNAAGYQARTEVLWSNRPLRRTETLPGLDPTASAH